MCKPSTGALASLHRKGGMARKRRKTGARKDDNKNHSTNTDASEIMLIHLKYLFILPNIHEL